MRNSLKGPNAALRKAQPGPGVRSSLWNASQAVQIHKWFKLSKNSSRAITEATPSTQARELPCGAWSALPRVLHIPLGAGYSDGFAHRVSASAEEPAHAPDVHVTAHALLAAWSPPRKRKGRREQHFFAPPPTPGGQTARSSVKTLGIRPRSRSHSLFASWQSGKNY